MNWLASWLHLHRLAEDQGNDREDRLVVENNHHKRLALQKILSVEELETILAGTNTRASHRPSPT